jgi:hypothetical protein
VIGHLSGSLLPRAYMCIESDNCLFSNIPLNFVFHLAIKYRCDILISRRQRERKEHKLFRCRALFDNICPVNSFIHRFISSPHNVAGYRMIITEYLFFSTYKMICGIVYVQ